jgi:hypothetical protein
MAEKAGRPRILDSFRSVSHAIRPALASPAFLPWLAIGLGVLFRVVEFAWTRAYWEDETALAANVVGRPVFELDRPLVRCQMASPGFLVAVRIWSRAIGGSIPALRLSALACGIGVLFAMRSTARRYVSAAAVPVAIALAAVSDDLIYYATEFKQYSADLLIALGCWAMGIGLASAQIRPRRWLTAVALGVAATWCSQTAILILGGVAATLGLSAILRKDRGRVAATCGLGLAWAASFAGAYVVSSRQIDEGCRRFLWLWWDFAFLRLPPTSLAEAQQDFWQLVNVFVNPAGLETFFNPVVTGLLGLALFAIGGLAMTFRGRRTALAMLMVPVLLAIVASALRRYPFHNRLIVFLTPAFLLPVAEGCAEVGRRLGPLAGRLLVAFLLLAPLVGAIDHFDHPHRRVFDSHGDQRNDMLDYIEGYWPSISPWPGIPRRFGPQGVSPPSPPPSSDAAGQAKGAALDRSNPAR